MNLEFLKDKFKLSELAQYYFVSFAILLVSWGLLWGIGIEFVNLVFFILAYVWHFTLQTPGLKEKVIKSQRKSSFLSVIVYFNHYLQVLASSKLAQEGKKAQFRKLIGTALVRALSPLLFVLLLLILGGGGNVVFAFLGSFVFECQYYLLKTTLTGKANQENGTDSSSAENSPE